MRLWMLCLALPLWSNPTQPMVRAGEVSCVGEGTARLTVTSSSDRAIVDWGDFSIGPHERVDMLLPSAKSALLNRVVGHQGTDIQGNLRSNGAIYILNERGIVIGPDARIDTGAFVASTLDVSNAAFLEGGELLFAGDSEGQIAHYGSIRARNGDVFLIGSRIVQEGAVHAPQGHAGLAVGQEVLIRPAGFERIYIRPHPEKKRRDYGINEKGLVEALQATLAADGSLYMLAICHTGTIDAAESISFQAERGRVETSGSSSSPGGRIEIEGDEFVMRRAGILDTTAPGGGGVLSIQTNLLFAEPDTYIGADALENGSGGQISLQGRSLLSFSGTVSARGGPQGGDGGLITLRGEGEIDPFGGIDIHSPLGKRGVIALEGHQATMGGELPPFFELLRLPRGSDTMLPTTCLVAWLEQADVSLRTSGTLQLTGSVTTSGGTLFLHADGEASLMPGAQYNLGGPFSLTTDASLTAGVGSSLAATDALQLSAPRGNLTLDGMQLALRGAKGAPLLLLAGDSLALHNTALANTALGGSVDLVADFGSEAVGPGHLTVDATSHISTAEGPLTLYGAQHSQLHISGSLNGHVPHLDLLPVARYPNAPAPGLYGKMGRSLPPLLPTPTYASLFFSERFRYDRRGLYATPVHLTAAMTHFTAMVSLHQEKYLAP